MYEGANHAFNNDIRPARYDKVAANTASARTIAFLGSELAVYGAIRMFPAE